MSQNLQRKLKPSLQESDHNLMVLPEVTTWVGVASRHPNVYPFNTPSKPSTCAGISLPLLLPIRARPCGKGLFKG
jgi:hypothetical protein